MTAASQKGTIMEVSDADRALFQLFFDLPNRFSAEGENYDDDPRMIALAYHRATQAAELDALRGEVERLTLDGIHTCSDACQRPACVLRRENAQLRDRVAGLEHIASDLLQHIDWLTCGLPKMLEDASLTDEEGLIGAAVDAANSARALLSQNEVG